jgi:hypothetical protein
MATDLNELVGNRPDKTFGEAELLESWGIVARDLGLDPALGEEAVLEVARDATALATDQLDPAFGGAWEWDLSDGVIKTVLASALLAGVLSAAGVIGLTPVVIPTVIPFLFDLKRVRLEREAERVIRIIGARPEMFRRRGSHEDLYRSLPDDVREHVTLREFSDFIEDAIRVGAAEEVSGVVQVFQEGDAELRLWIR